MTTTPTAKMITTSSAAGERTTVLDELERIHHRYNSHHVEDLISFLDAVEDLLAEHGRRPLTPARWEGAVYAILAEAEQQMAEPPNSDDEEVDSGQHPPVGLPGASRVAAEGRSQS